MTARVLRLVRPTVASVLLVIGCLAGVGDGVASADTATNPCSTRALPLNQIASGTITLQQPACQYRGHEITVSAGDYEAQAWGETPQGEELDTVLYVYGPKGASGYPSWSMMAASDDANSGGLASTVRISLRDGTYRIIVSTYRQSYAGTYHVLACPAGTCAKARAEVPQVPDAPRAPG
jgi:hypothetical protein